MSPGALAGVRVADFGQYVAGPMAGMLLADQGADVVHVDPPGGPRWDTPANAVWNRGKQAITLDLRDPGGLATARRLCGAADVILENFRPGVMDRLGLGADATAAANPRAVYCSMPGFAADDPRAGLPGWEGVVSAASAAYSPLPRPGAGTSPDGARPVFSAVPMASCFAAFLAVVAVTAALRARARLGRGQRIEVPLFDATFTALGYRAGRLPPAGLPPASADTAAPARLLGLYECADGGWIYFHTGSKRAQAFLEAAGAGGLPGPEGARERLATVLATRPAREWEDLGHLVGAEVAMLRSSAQWLREPHARHSGLVTEVTDPQYGPMLQPGLAVTMSATPGEVRPAPVPHTDEAAVLASLTTAERAAERAADAPAPAPADGAGPDGAGPEAGALAGVRVVDLAIVLAGPTCGRTLAELGADVVKVEMPAERSRRGPGMAAGSAVAAAFNIDVNRGKESIILDLRSEAGRAVLWDLIDWADVLVENFRSGVIDRLGFGYDAVRARRPDLVYASLNTYGYRGPWRDRPGHEQLAQTVSGMAERYGGDGPPALQNVGALDDYGTGLMGAYAVIAALLHRDATGAGQRVTTALAATAGTLQAAFGHDYPGKLWDEPRGQDAPGWSPLQQLYQGSDGEWFFLGAGPAELAAVPGLDGAADGAADGAPAQLRDFLTAAFGQEPAGVWVARLTAAGAGAHLVVPLDALLADPWVREHGLIAERQHEGVGLAVQAGPAMRLSLTPARIGRPAPQPGADRDAVLARVGRQP